MMATRDEMLLELNHWRDRYGPPRWQNRAMHDLIGEIIAVVGDGPSGPRVAEPAGMWEKVTAAHETFINLGDTGAAPGELLDAATELSSALVNAQVAAAPVAPAGLILTLTDDALTRREVRAQRVVADDLNTRYLVAIDADGKPYRFEARHLVELRPDTGAP